MSRPFEDSGESGGGYKRCRCGWWEPVLSAICGNAAHDGNIRALDAQHAVASPAPSIEAKSPGNAVDHPPHYNASPAKCSKCGHPIECIDVVETMGFSLGNVIKYLWRADLKGKLIEDLKKAAWYLNREIERREKL